MPRDFVSEREKKLPVSVMPDLLKIAEEDRSVISLGPGEPDFDSPENIISFAKKGLDQGYTHYSPTGGRTELKELIVKKLRKENRVSVGEDQVIVTCGSTEAILLSLLCTVDAGDGVLLPDPGFLAYRPAVELVGGYPVSIPLREEREFQLDVGVMQELVMPERCRVLIINSPSNPTGVVFSRKVLEDIADFAVENDVLVISDEAYEKFIYRDVEHVSFASLNGMGERTVTLQSLSKTYAMPGFRVGYAAGPEAVINAMRKAHVYTSLCAPTISQVAAMEALSGEQGSVGRMVREYDRRRKLMVKRLRDIPGFRCVEPMGAFYAFPNISSFGMKSLKLSKWLLEDAKVSVVPGTEFGRHGEGFIRLSYATSYELIEKALRKIQGAVVRLQRSSKRESRS